MADVANRFPVYAGEPSWGAIWAGVFSFVAIWSIFGTLGEAIFASAANPHAANPVLGMSTGMEVWAVILTIIAFYVAGRVTAHLSAAAVDRGGRIMHGMAMFGLSVVGVLLMVVIAGTALTGGTGAAASAHNSYVLTVFSDIGWAGFVALFLGWLAAIGGASHGPLTRATISTSSNANVRDIRPAA